MCSPACGGNVCGDDGCGGSCGTCAPTELCEEGACVPDAPAVTCPPAGPFGTSVGSTAKDVILKDCDGVEYSIHDLCESKASFIFGFAGW